MKYEFFSQSNSKNLFILSRDFHGPHNTLQLVHLPSQYIATDHSSIGFNRLTIHLMFNEVRFFAFSQGLIGFWVSRIFSWWGERNDYGGIHVYARSNYKKFLVFKFNDPATLQSFACPRTMTQISKLSDWNEHSTFDSRCWWHATTTLRLQQGIIATLSSSH